MGDFYYTGKINKKDKSIRNKFHGFFTRNGGVSQGNFYSLNCAFNKKEDDGKVIENRKIVCSKITQSAYERIIIKQIHSNKVLEIDQNNKKDKIIGDGLITKEKGLFLGILTADCAPLVFIGDEYVGIIHVGWKGLLNGIIERTINLLKKKGEKESRLSCYIGPHLQCKSFQIREDFKENLLKYNKNNTIFLKSKDGKEYFDFSMFILFKLNQYKLSSVSSIDLDTYSNPSLFFSHRYSKQRDIESCGRQISVVGIFHEKNIY